MVAVLFLLSFCVTEHWNIRVLKFVAESVDKTSREQDLFVFIKGSEGKRRLKCTCMYIVSFPVVLETDVHLYVNH